MGCGRVALIDSGVAAEHPHLAGASLEGFSLCFGAKGVQRGTDFSDCTGHGTAIAAALYRSVPSATIVAVRVLDSELRTTTSALVAAIEAAVLEGCVVLNLSLGSQAGTSSRPRWRQRPRPGPSASQQPIPGGRFCGLLTCPGYSQPKPTEAALLEPTSTCRAISHASSATVSPAPSKVAAPPITSLGLLLPLFS